MTEDINDDQLKEPGVSYWINKAVTVFHSFEEMNDSDISEMAAMLPEDRIRQTVELILRVYGVTREDLEKRNSRKITFLSKR